METKRKLKKKRSRESSETATGGSLEDMKPSSHGATENNKHHRNETNGHATHEAVATASTASSRPVDVSFTKGSANAAAISVTKKEHDSEIYKKLFHSDKETMKSGRDLMMNVAGFRYGLS